MQVVVDANLLVALASGDRRADLIARRFHAWFDAGASLHAPDLALYEAANSLTRMIVAGQLAAERAAAAWSEIVALPVHLHPLVDGWRAIEIALDLERATAYDAAYLMLAEQLGAELWTADGKLYRNASGRGYPVRGIE